FPSTRGVTSSRLLFVVHPPPTALYTLSLHDALPIYRGASAAELDGEAESAETGLGERPHRLAGQSALMLPLQGAGGDLGEQRGEDRKSTRLNSSHVKISYAVFCLKKKKNKTNLQTPK